MSRQIRISASRLKTLWECSLKFYYQEIQWLPQSTHWKTKVGTIVHLLFEVIMHPRRRALFEHIMVSGRFAVSDHPVLVRFVRWQLRREGIAANVTIEEIGELTHVAFLGIRPHFIHIEGKETLYSPPPRFENEYRFKITLPSGAVISGFIDLLLIWSDHVLVIDLKSQAAKFTRAELPHNVQAIMYQTVGYRETGIVPAVEFIMVRHPPTARTPDKHIQRVEPPSVATLQGLEGYVDSIYARVNSFSLEDAYSNACDDQGYCQFKCGYLRPFTYWVVCGKDDPTGNTPLSTHLVLDEGKQACYDAGNGATLLERRHPGCALRWNPNQATAS